MLPHAFNSHLRLSSLALCSAFGPPPSLFSASLYLLFHLPPITSSQQDPAITLIRRTPCATTWFLHIFFNFCNRGEMTLKLWLHHCSECLLMKLPEFVSRHAATKNAIHFANDSDVRWAHNCFVLLSILSPIWESYSTFSTFFSPETPADLQNWIIIRKMSEQ